MITREDLIAATPAVLSQLRALVELPAHGTVAGQAVASLFYKELNIGVTGPINDVDIFVSCRLPPEQRAVVHTSQAAYVKKVNPTAVTSVSYSSHDESEYMHVKFICSRSNVTLLRTYQDGLRNFTLIKHNDIHGEGEQTPTVAQDIVNGFDLNLVCVGIDLHSQQVVCTPKFIDFLNHKTIEVTTCNTPSHTLVRLAKKVHIGEITGAQCDYQKQRSMLETNLAVVHNNKKYLNNSCHLVTTMGGKYQQTAQRFAQYLPPLCVAQKTPEVTLYHFNPQKLRPHKALDSIEQLIAGHNTSKDPLQVLVAYVYRAHFPALFNLACQPNVEWNTVRAAMDIHSSWNMGERLNALSTVLNKEPLIDPQLDMHTLFAATFFFNSTLTSDQRSTIVQQYNSLPADDKKLFHHSFNHAKDFSTFYDNIEEHRNAYLNSQGWDGVLTLIEHNPDNTRTLVERALAFADTQQPHQSMSYIGENFAHKSATIFAAYPPQEHFTLLHRMAKMTASELDRLRSAKAYAALTLAYHNGLWNEQWDNAARWPASEGIKQFMSARVKLEWLDTPHHIAFVHKMLNVLDDTQLFDDHACVLRNVLIPRHYEIVKQRLALIPDQQEVRTRFSEVAAVIPEGAAKERGTLWSSSPEKHNGRHLTPLWNKLLLELHMDETSTRSARRRM